MREADMRSQEAAAQQRHGQEVAALQAGMEGWVAQAALPARPLPTTTMPPGRCACRLRLMPPALRAGSAPSCGSGWTMQPRPRVPGRQTWRARSASWPMPGPAWMPERASSPAGALQACTSDALGGGVVGIPMPCRSANPVGGCARRCACQPAPGMQPRPRCSCAAERAPALAPVSWAARRSPLSYAGWACLRAAPGLWKRRRLTSGPWPLRRRASVPSAWPVLQT